MWKQALLGLLILAFLACGGDSPGRHARSVYKQGEVLVKFRTGVREMQKSGVHDALGAKAVRTLGLEGLERIMIPEGMPVEEAVAMYRANPAVEYAEPNFIVRAAILPDDTRFSELWGMHNTGQAVNGTFGTSDADIDGPEAWEVVRDASSVTVAVIDTGVDGNHPDLSENLAAGYDFINNDADPDDQNGHGTHVAGILGAVGNNARGVTGVNWRVKIMPLKVLDQDGEGTIADVIEAIVFAASNNARIVNMSLSGPDYSQSLYNVIALYPGILFVAAAGNGGQDGIGDNEDVTPGYPAGFNLPNVLSVAASDQNDNLALFSNYGRASVDVAAPGENILSTIPSFATGVTYSGFYRVAYLAFGFEGINGSASRNAVMQAVLDFHAIVPGDQILLVDDDGGKSYENYFAQSLQALGHAFDKYSVPAGSSGPAAGQLMQYRLVIWFTGDQYSSTLTLNDQTHLSSFLDNGGRLFITGQDIGYDIGTSSFYQNYLHALYITDDANGDVFTGMNVFSGIAAGVPLNFGDGARNQRFIDAVQPFGSVEAFRISYHDAYQFFSGTSMSTPIVGGIAALVAAVYSDFNADQIKGTILNTVDQKPSLLNRILSGGRVNAYSAVTSLLPPAALNAQVLSNTGVALDWTDNATGEDGFRIERKEAGGQFLEIASVTKNQTSYTDAGLVSGKTYTYRVRAFNALASSGYSNEASATLPGGGQGNGNGGGGGRGGGGGGGGCSIGRTANCPTSAADAAVFMVPVAVVWVLRRMRRY